MILSEMNDSQRRVFIDATQLYEAYIETFRKSRSYRGGMHWKKSKDKEYLFRSRDRMGYGKSLGPRSTETEKLLDEFRKNKKNLNNRLKSLQDRLNEQARFCKAALIQRVPRIVCKILKVLDLNNLLGRNVLVIGTNAMYAYEAAAGVFLESPVLATQDMDLLWDVRPELTLYADPKIDQTGLINLLRKADRSFEPITPRSYRAVNRTGYMVDLIKPEPKSMLKKERKRMGIIGDLEATEIRNLNWPIASPKFIQNVIGDDGYPVKMAVPDPRGFVLHKIWMSQQPDREPVKKQRDHNQAITVGQLIAQYLPQFEFETDQLKMFPKAVVEAGSKVILSNTGNTSIS